MPTYMLVNPCGGILSSSEDLNDVKENMEFYRPLDAVNRLYHAIIEVNGNSISLIEKEFKEDSHNYIEAYRKRIKR